MWTAPIKLILWDLDDTLWRGTLADGDAVALFEQRAEMIRAFNARGVVSSICSKNDFDAARAKLEAFGLWDEFVFPHIAKQDIVITTALIPGRAAPRLISDTQIATMRSGSVIVDLAVEQGGNVEGSVPGEIVERHGVKIIGHRNVPNRLATDSSALFARNLINFLSAFWDKDAGKPGC